MAQKKGHLSTINYKELSAKIFIESSYLILWASLSLV